MLLVIFAIKSSFVGSFHLLMPGINEFTHLKAHLAVSVVLFDPFDLFKATKYSATILI